MNLSENLINIVKKEGKMATLAIDYYWYKAGVVDPESAYVPAGVIQFDKKELDFSALQRQLKEEGLYLSNYPGQSFVYLIANRPYKSTEFLGLFR